MEEVWKDIIGYEGLYIISNLGRVKSLDRYIPRVDGKFNFQKGKIIAIIHRYDDVEEKWVVAPEGKTFTVDEIKEQVDFQEQYFNSEIRI